MSNTATTTKAKITADLDIARESELWDALPAAEALIERATIAALNGAGRTLLPHVELAVLLADDAEVRRVNAQWREKDKPTNILSFPSVEPAKIAKAPYLGDLILAFETIRAEGEEDEKSFEDHVSHLIVHGVLHLLGFDHIDESEAEAMEALEVDILAGLGIADPYSEFDLVSHPTQKA